VLWIYKYPPIPNKTFRLEKERLMQMKEVKLWEVSEKDGKIESITNLRSVNQTKTEDQLEEIIVKHPELLYEGLNIVGRQTSTGGGPLDLLGVDEDGNLIVFELKRGTLTRDAVSQVIDYASYLAELDPKDLANHITERSGNLGVEKIENFAIWYEEQYQKTIYDIQKPAMVLIGLGVDECTRRMVSYLANNEINISLLTFYGFEENGKTYIAKQVEVSGKQPGRPSSLTKQDRLDRLQKRIATVGVGQFFDDIAKFIETNLSAYKWPNQNGYSFYLQDFKEDGSLTNLVYASIKLNDNIPNKAEVMLLPRAIDIASKTYDAFKENLPLNLENKESGGVSLWIESLDQWTSVADEFHKLCKGIRKGWKEKRKSHTDTAV
jgi:DNA-directed RNA polymerase subunit N (RpoN/RPB10)